MTERLSHGEPAWFAGGRKTFVMYADRHHDSRVASLCRRPGWLGVYLDVDALDLPRVDWAHVEQIVEMPTGR